MVRYELPASQRSGGGVRPAKAGRFSAKASIERTWIELSAVTSKPSSGMLVCGCIEIRLLSQSAPEVEAWQFLPMAHFLVNRCQPLFHSTNNRDRKDPPPLARGRVFSATATAISNIRMLEPQAQKQTTHRAAHRRRVDRTSIGRPSGNRWPDASLAPSCEDYVNEFPVLRAESPERPKPYKADCVRSHDCC